MEMIFDQKINAWKNRLTRFEIARVIGARALQLSLGAPPLINPDEAPVKDPVAIAILELLKGLLPMTIKRMMPNGEYELVPVSKALSPDNRRYLETTLKSWTLSLTS
ncbi:DNA-directed RNA polymerase subunit K [Staphylothermus marinus]|uniref:DNA-directed RNA polymerase subunit K n=1 Tax=Staphylothermus marinus TaxID=2280 RepID=UPI0001D6284A